MPWLTGKISSISSYNCELRMLALLATRLRGPAHCNLDFIEWKVGFEGCWEYEASVYNSVKDSPEPLPKLGVNAGE